MGEHPTEDLGLSAETMCGSLRPEATKDQLHRNLDAARAIARTENGAESARANRRA
jgi:hypothetical protein